MRASKHFKRSEFTCKCGCGFDTVDFELVAALDAIRDHFDSPVIITSGCRCPTYNTRVDGEPGSQHMKGRAADIIVEGTPPPIVAELAEQMEMGGVGRYKNFTHIDTRRGKARWAG
jgi:uncharacterized protein YcbK (DUF882 family)